MHLNELAIARRCGKREEATFSDELTNAFRRNDAHEPDRLARSRRCRGCRQRDDVSLHDRRISNARSAASRKRRRHQQPKPSPIASSHPQRESHARSTPWTVNPWKARAIASVTIHQAGSCGRRARVCSNDETTRRCASRGAPCRGEARFFGGGPRRLQPRDSDAHATSDDRQSSAFPARVRSRGAAERDARAGAIRFASPTGPSCVRRARRADLPGRPHARRSQDGAEWARRVLRGPRARALRSELLQFSLFVGSHTLADAERSGSRSRRSRAPHLAIMLAVGSTDAAERTCEDADVASHRTAAIS